MTLDSQDQKPRGLIAERFLQAPVYLRATARNVPDPYSFV